ncbi:glutathione peroxidase-like isoform X2 [Artemia franciscana]
MMLIVPIASFSEDTYQVVELNALHNNYQFLEVLAFPTKQFGHDEPAANGTEVMNELSHVRPGNKFKPHFHLFNIVDVNGRSEHPLFKFLKDHCIPTRDEFANVRELNYSPLKSKDIRWNFEKFLINKHGHPIIRYDSKSRIGDIKKDVEHDYFS